VASKILLSRVLLRKSGRGLQTEQMRNAPLAVLHSTTLCVLQGDRRHTRQRFGVRQSSAAFDKPATGIEGKSK
jgi:hypothetical protein